MTKLLIATHNQGKKAEYAALFASLGLELMTLSDLGISAEVAENGHTFAENALAKARGYAAMSGLPTLADDSGLVVDALDGEPGVFSARYGGDQAVSDEDRYRLLLARLAQVPDAQRTARFECAIAVVMPDGREEVVQGSCEGCITHAPRGTNGFGYDPVFYMPSQGCTMAELVPEIKNHTSHRARAAQAALPLLAALLA